jgi:rare lipoprotein A
LFSGCGYQIFALWNVKVQKVNKLKAHRLFAKRLLLMKRHAFTLLLAVVGLAAQAQEVARIGYAERGKASFHADRRAEAVTRSGDPYAATAMEAAHKFIAFNSLVKVTNLANQRSVVVRVNDRPATDQHVLVMTQAAAEALAFKGSEAEVLLEVIALGVPRNPADQVAAAVRDQPATEPPSGRTYYENEEGAEEKGYLNTAAKPEVAKEVSADLRKPKANPVASSANNRKPAIVAKPAGQASVQNQKKMATLKESVRQTVDDAKANNAKVAKDHKVEAKKSGAKKPVGKTETPYAPGGTYTLKGERVRPAGYGLQVAAYGEVDKALAEAKKLEGKKPGKLFIQSGWANGKKSYRVMVGTYLTKAEADKAATALRKKKINTIPKKHFEE